MQTTIVKWGNSQGVRLPKAFLKNIQLTENDPVDIVLEKGKIVIQKTKAAKHKSTRKRLIEFYGTDYNKKQIIQKEIDWGKPLGKEIW